MRSDYRKSAVVILVAVFLIACGSVLYIPTAENTSNHADLERLKKGRELYINNCAGCHTLYAPEKYSKSEWTKLVNDMALKTDLTEEQKAFILSYLSKNE